MTIRDGRIYNDTDLDLSGSTRTTNPRSTARSEGRSNPVHQTTGGSSVYDHFTVYFDRCGGTTVQPRRCRRGDTVTMPTQNDISRRGFVLVGWAHLYNPDTVVARPGEQVTVTSDTTYRAVWRRSSSSQAGSRQTGRTYTVTLNMGSGSVERVPGLSGQITLPTGAQLGISGRTLVNWMCNGRAYSPGAYVNLTSDMTFTPLWRDSPEFCRVSFRPCGGSSIPDRSINRNSRVNLPTAIDITREGFTLSGWRCDGTVYSPGAMVTVNRNTEFEAQWKPIQTTCRVTFNTLGGTRVEDRFVSSGSMITLPSARDISRSGYVLLGWRCSGVSYRPGDDVTIRHDSIFDATWRITDGAATASCALKLEGVSGTHLPSLVSRGTSVRLPSATDVRRDGYALKGWWFSDVFYSPGSTFVVTRDSTLTPEWEPFLTVSFDTGGGSSCDSESVARGTQITLPSRSVRTGYELAGWDDGTHVMDPGRIYTVHSDITFHAVWHATVHPESVTNHTVSIIVDEGRSQNVTVPEGELTLPTNSDLNPRGRRLTGWVCNNHYYAPGSTINVDSDLTITALWRQETDREREKEAAYERATSRKVDRISFFGLLSRSIAASWFVILLMCVLFTVLSVAIAAIQLGPLQAALLVLPPLLVCLIGPIRDPVIGAEIDLFVLMMCFFYADVYMTLFHMIEATVLVCALLALSLFINQRMMK